MAAAACPVFGEAAPGREPPDGGGVAVQGVFGKIELTTGALPRNVDIWIHGTQNPCAVGRQAVESRFGGAVGLSDNLQMGYARAPTIC